MSDAQDGFAEVELEDLTLHFDRADEDPDLIGSELLGIALS
jgi:hypothetical protein